MLLFHFFFTWMDGFGPMYLGWLNIFVCYKINKYFFCENHKFEEFVYFDLCDLKLPFGAFF